MTKLDAIFARNLVAIRRAKGYRSADALAEALEISLRSLQRYESGKRLPASELIEEMASVLGVQVQDFFRSDEVPVVEVTGKAEPVSIFAARLTNIPDEIWALAQEFADPKDQVIWDAVKGAINRGIKKKTLLAEREANKAQG